MPRPIVFISCGQREDYEVALGNEIAEEVRTAGYEPFFAQQKSDLRNLSEAIFDTLSRSSAYIAVLHRREKFEGRSESRASLFIEQELAIAAYLRRTCDLPVLFYAQRDVELSGVRSTLLLNVSLPNKKVFEKDSEVIDHVRATLPTLSLSSFVMHGPNVRLEVSPTWASDGSNMMRVGIVARNNGTELPNRAILRVWVPHEFELPGNLSGRAGDEGEFTLLQRTLDGGELIDLDPERPTTIFSFPVPMIRGFAEKQFKFRLVADRQQPQTLLFSYQQLWKAADAKASLTERDSA